MEEKRESHTALMVAAFRARASAREDALFVDPWAKALAGAQGQRFADNYAQFFPAMELWIAVRTAFLDRWLQLHLEREESIRQVVILGAGCDTRAARLGREGGVFEGVRFFEVDTPASQRDKRARLAALEDYPEDAAVYVSCDFAHDDFLDRLREEGFDANAPAFFIWEGVTYYLTEETVRATLQRFVQGCHPGSLLAFDYVSRRFVERKIRPQDEKSLDILDGMGEPMQFGCNDILPLLYEEGFRFVQTASFDEACLLLTQTYARERMFRFQGLALAGCQTPKLWLPQHTTLAHSSIA